MTIFRLLCLLFLAFQVPFAFGQPSAEQQLLNEVYATEEERLTLYCQTPFQPEDRVRIERVYPQRVLLDHFGCNTARSCEMNADYLVIWNDLHQMFPITASTRRIRRGTTIGDTRLEEPTHECGFKTTFQTFEPSDHTKGEVARALLYLHHTYNIPLMGNVNTLQDWNRLDPPDDFEVRRNQRIADIQGASNPFIDDPELAERITLDLLQY